MKRDKIRILHLLNHIQNSGAANLLYSQLPYYSSNIKIHIGYLLRDEGIFQNSERPKLIKFPFNSLKNISTLYKIRNYIIDNKIKILHTHLIQSSLIGRFISLTLPQIKIITTKHSVHYSNPKNLIYRLENNTIEYSDAIICISEYVKNYLKKRGVPQNKLFRIYNGIDYEYFSSTQLPKNKQKIIGTVAMCTEQKGLDILLSAFSKVLENKPGYKLEIVGDGPLLNDLKKLAQELNISTNVQFIGKIPHKAVKRRMETWQVFILPSRWEAFGLVIVEANAVGLPVIATKVGAIPELIRDGVNGLLVEPENIDELAKKINYILSHSDEREKMGRKGKRYIRRFDIRKTVKKKEKLYNKILTQR